MRLIDADALKPKLPEFGYGLPRLICEEVQKIVDSAPTVELSVSPTNLPLTLEELREMEYGPLWIIEGKLGHWALCEPLEGKSGIWCIDQYGDGPLPLKDYGVGWLAYRRKQEE